MTAWSPRTTGSAAYRELPLAVPHPPSVVTVGIALNRQRHHGIFRSAHGILHKRWPDGISNRRGTLASRLRAFRPVPVAGRRRTLDSNESAIQGASHFAHVLRPASFARTVVWHLPPEERPREAANASRSGALRVRRWRGCCGRMTASHVGQWSRASSAHPDSRLSAIPRHQPDRDGHPSPWSGAQDGSREDRRDGERPRPVRGAGGEASHGDRSRQMARSAVDSRRPARMTSAGRGFTAVYRRSPSHCRCACSCRSCSKTSRTGATDYSTLTQETSAVRLV